MIRASLPFLFLPTSAVRARLGRDLDKVAVLAAKAIIARCDGAAVALQQISYGKHCLAFSSRIGAQGDLILELDLGDERLSKRLILADEYRRADRAKRAADDEARHGRRRQGNWK